MRVSPVGGPLGALGRTLRSAPGRAVLPAGATPRPGDAARAAGPEGRSPRGRSSAAISGAARPPACVVHGSLARTRSALCWTPLACCLFVSPASAFVGCSFWRERDGLGRGAREELAEEEKERAGATLHPSLPPPFFPLMPVSLLQLLVQMFGGTPELGGVFGTSK